MNIDKKESFILYASFYEPIKDLNNEDLGILFRSIFEYQLEEKEYQGSDKNMKTIFKFFQNQFRIDEKKYAKKCGTNQENGKKGGLARAENQRLENQKLKVDIESLNYPKDKFEIMWTKYQEKATRPIGDKNKAIASFAKVLEKHTIQEIGKSCTNYINELLITKQYNKDLNTFLDNHLEEYLTKEIVVPTLPAGKYYDQKERPIGNAPSGYKLEVITDEMGHTEGWKVKEIEICL